jgi:hypothetical protein
MIYDGQSREDLEGGYRAAAAAADRFRDVLSECLGHSDENPGDDVLVAELRTHFGKTGPEPVRWRNFLTGVLAEVDQIRAGTALIEPCPECVQGKCRNCDGTSWDQAADAPGPCPCATAGHPRGGS